MSATSRVKLYLRGAWRELPWESAMAVVGVATSMILVDGNPLGKAVSEVAVRLLLAAIVATPALFAITLLFRARRIGSGSRHVLGGGVATAAAGTLLAVSDASLGADWFAWSYGLSLLTCALLPFATVALAANSDARFPVFASFTRRFAEATTAFSLQWGAAAAALAVVFAAVAGLFDLDVALLGVRCGILMTAGFLVAYFFELLPQPLDEQTTVVPDIWRKLVTAVGAPFTATMIAILSTYEVWVLATGQIPKNLLSPLIIGAGVVGLFCALIVQSILLHEHSHGAERLSPAVRKAWEKVPSIRIVRALPAAILALLPMAGWAVYVRVEQYGFTPFRVTRTMALASLLVIGVWGTLRWVRGRVPLSWQVPAVATLFAAITAVGPLSARSLSVASQSARLEALLDQYGVTERNVGRDAAGPDIDLEQEPYDEIRSRVSALISYGALDSVLPGSDAVCRRKWQADECLERLSIRRIGNEWDDAPEHTADNTGPVETRFGTLYREFHVWRNSPHRQGEYTFSVDGNWLVVKRGLAEMARVEVPVRTRPLPGELAAGDVGLVIPQRIRWRATAAGDELESIHGQWLELRSTAPAQ